MKNRIHRSIGLALALACLAVAGARASDDIAFTLRPAHGETVFGPFDLKEGNLIAIGTIKLSLSGSARAFYLREVRGDKVYGPFRLRDGNVIKLGRSGYVVQTGHVDDLLKEQWDRVAPKIDKALEVQADYEDAPRKRWFGADKKSLGEKLDEILSVISDLLVTDVDLIEARARIYGNQEEIRELRGDIQDLLEKKISADEGARNRYDRKIDDLREDIGEIEQDSLETRQRLQEDLATYGLKLTAEQVEVLLSRADGKDVLSIVALLHGTQGILQQLRKVYVESGQNVGMARKYYGTYFLLMRAVRLTQDEYGGRIEELYVPKLQEVIEDAERNRKDARRGLSREGLDETQKSVLLSNIKANELTIDVANRYIAMLRRYGEKLEAAEKKTRNAEEVALNSYRTVTTRENLDDLMAVSLDEVQGLLSLHVPELEPFENTDVADKFGELTRMISD